MAEINANIPMSYQFGPTIGEHFQNAVKLADLMDQRKQRALEMQQMQQDMAQKAIMNPLAVKAAEQGITETGQRIDYNTEVNPVKIEQEKTTSRNLFLNNRELATKIKELDLKRKEENLNIIAQSIPDVNDEASYQDFMNMAKELLGNAADDMPKNYGPEAQRKLKYIQAGYDAKVLEKQKAAQEQQRINEEIRNNKEKNAIDWYNAKKPPVPSASLIFREGQWTDKQVANMGNDLDPTKGVRGQYAVSYSNQQRAESIEALMKRFPNENLSPQEIVDLSTGLYTLISRSNVPSEKLIQGIMPKSLLGKANEFIQWFSNNPRGAGQQKFVERMGKTVVAERLLAQNQLKRDAYKKISKWASVERDAPDDWAGILTSRGIDPVDYKKWVADGKPEIRVQPTFDNNGNIISEGGDWKGKEKGKASTGSTTIKSDSGKEYTF